MRSDSKSLTSFSLRIEIGTWMTDSHPAGVSGLTMQAAHEVEGALGIGRPFHVNADEVVNAHGMVEQIRDQPKGQIFADVQGSVHGSA